MLSTVSLKSLLVTYRTAFVLKLVPYFWDSKEKRLVVLEENLKGLLWRCQAYAGLLGRILFGIYFAFYSVLLESSGDGLLTLLFISIWFLTGPLHAFNLTRSPQIVRHFNSLLSMNSKAENVLSNIIELDKSDGLEGVLQMMATMAVVSEFSVPIGVFYSIFKELPMFRFLNFGPDQMILTVLASLTFSYLLTMDWTFGAMELYTIVLNSNTIYLWQLKMEKAWLKIKSDNEMESLRFLRRAFETHHLITLDTHDAMIGINVMMGEVYMTIITFSLMRFRNNFHIFIACAFFCFTVYTLNAVKLTVCIAANLGEASKRSAGVPKFWIPDQYVTIYRRGRPMEVQLGKSVKLKQGTFLSILNDIVINYVINLLLTF